MPTVKVDGVEIEVPQGATVLQACELAGKEIPRFCYHERLTIAGNCRMCLVEVKPGPPKPQASCALPAADGQEISTMTPAVKKAREGVMEFLLINHPLDCPICDQGGECDLQDQSIAYGRGHSRFHENKRAVTEKYMGPVVKTIMTRCIQCTRCIRFAEEVAGTEEIGAIGRGENMQITSYLEGAVTSELSGNVVDLCPVGALVSKPYSFEARPWELRKIPGIDVMDAVGTNIRIDHRFREVMRALPRINEDVNEEWAHDKTRHAVDGLVRRRLDRPWVRREGKLQPATWAEAFEAIAARLQGASGDQVAGIAGDLQDLESIYALKALLRAYGSSLHESRQDNAKFDVSSPAAYRFNATIAGLETAPAILLIGSNPRWEAPLVNTRIRKAVKRGAKVFRIGPPVDLTYPVTDLGADLAALGNLPEALRDAFADKENAAVIVGMGALVHDGAYEAARAAAASLGASFSLLHTAASRVGALDIGFATDGGVEAIARRAGELKALFLLGVDEMDTSAFADTFTVYIGTHGDRGVAHADVILPGAAYTEKHGTYVNLEGRVQFSEFAVHPPGEAREDWTILRALSDALGKTLPFDDLSQLRAAIRADFPHLGEAGLTVFPAPAAPAGGTPQVSGAIVYPIEDFYLTNPIARASPTLQRCSAEILHGQVFEEAAE
ncbi:NADH-quinone oxidoreductase subunit G [Sphingomonas parva]|uniref:NADH-quinone oxidoreductase n=1 Tax=Sphingomonas parva TaxID=2555898 RepID=A0A4Y8ZMT4_9SPHN|nr:NADH-quinone oxidoreductase subunit NuoG [Sphingomonas parva]TFI56767.1 NADH-quinone oxidoreductase subunit G [Sphingomonas parva]